MSILVGVDFSPGSERALQAAAVLAGRMKQTLHLVHALEWSGEAEEAQASASYEEALRRRTEERAHRARKQGCEVVVHIGRGSPDDVLLEVARQVRATLLIVAALGKRHGRASTLGGHADRLAQSSHIPVLVVRDAAAFEAWATEHRPLRVVIGADHSHGSKLAMRWLKVLEGYGKCEVVAVHLYWPPAELHRLGLDGVRSYLEPDPIVTDKLEHELRHHLACEDDTHVKVRLEPHMGRIGDRVASIAAEEQADLVVVGCHARSVAGRVMEPSVSRIVLRDAPMSVACIPAPSVEQADELAVVRSIVVATDFSPAGNAAVAMAYRVAPKGATLHLVHVVPNAHRVSTEPHDIFVDPIAVRADPQRHAVRGQLADLIPRHALRDGKASEVHLLESAQPALAIAQAAERLEADLLCLGTRGHGGVVGTVLGSVAHAVLGKTKRPLLLARAPLE